MRREGCVCFEVCQKVLEHSRDRNKKLYNTEILTNKTVKHPYAHERIARSKCNLCKNQEKSGRYKRKNLKHEIIAIIKEIY